MIVSFCFLPNNKKGESVEISYGPLIEQAENFSLGDDEPTLIREAFILNMKDHDTQLEMLKETVSSAKALELAKHMEMGAQSQQKIHQDMNTTAQFLLSLNFKAAIATRITNNLVSVSLATKLFPRTTSMLDFALIVVNAGVITTVKFAPQMEKNAINMILLDNLQGNVESRKTRTLKYQNLPKRI